MVKHILVLGGGFAGIRLVQDLVKKLRRERMACEITLVDKETAHLFKADLFEVATAFNKKITESCLTQLKETIATPIRKLLPTGVNFVQDEVVGIDSVGRVVTLRKHGEFKYDYLVVTLGSEVNYFGISGLAKFAMTMKTMQDGIKFNCHLDEFFKALWKKKVRNRPVNIVIGGAGPTGVEMAAELIGSLRKLCRKYAYDCGKINVELVEGSEKLLSMGPDGTALVLKRLEKLGVRVLLQNLVQEVTAKEIKLKLANGKIEKKRYDILVWTGGVMVNPVVTTSLGDHTYGAVPDGRQGQDKKYGGAVLVNPYFQVYKDTNIFAGGDNAYFVDPKDTKRRLPMLGSVAVQEGAAMAENLFRSIMGERLVEFVPGKVQMVVPIGGKYAIWQSGNNLFQGRWVWVIRRLVYLKYAMSILPFWAALKKWLRSNRIFVEND